MTDDLIQEDGTEKQEIQEIQRENGHKESGSGKIATVKALLGNLYSNRRRLMVSILGFFMLMLVAGSLVFFFSGSDDKATESDDLAEMTDGGGQAALEKALDIVFEDIVVLAPFERISLKSSSAMGLISLGIALELTDHRSRKMVVAVEDRLRKIIQGQVREMTWLELRNPEGKIRLKYELLKRMNSVFPKVTIRNIYFTNFLMQ